MPGPALSSVSHTKPGGDVMSSQSPQGQNNSETPVPGNQQNDHMTK